MPQGLTHLLNGALQISVSDLGAELQSLRDVSGRDYLWHGDAAVWSGRSPVLFPIVGRAPDDRIAVGDFQAEMKQHGFARRSRFELVEAGEAFCRHQLTDSAESRAVYPFAFALTLTHRLDGRSLQIAAEVENRDDRDMPFCLGFHPAFAWPLPGAEGQVHFVTLDNGAEPELARLQDGLLPAARLASPFQNGRLELEQSLFEADAMIFPEGAGTGLRYGAEKGPGLRFQFEGLPNLALWTKPGAPFLCVEPWRGMAAHLGGSGEMADRPYAMRLAPGEARRFALTVTLERAER